MLNKLSRWFTDLPLKSKMTGMMLLFFGIIALLSAWSAIHIMRLSDSAVRQLQDNYRTLKYTREMSLALNDIIYELASPYTLQADKRKKLRYATDEFERYLELQTLNTTEEGEDSLTTALLNDFTLFKEDLKHIGDSTDISMLLIKKTRTIQELLKDMYYINEMSILQKTDQTVNNAQRIVAGMFFFGFILFTLALISISFIPDYISRPLNQLSQGLEAVALKKYSERLPVNSADEFGQLAHSFNLMVEKLEEYENINLQKLLSEKHRIETLIQQMRQGIIGVDNDFKVLFINQTALNFLQAREEEVRGESLRKLAQENALMNDFARELLIGVAYKNRLYPIIEIERNNKKIFLEKDILHVSAGPHHKGGYVIVLKNITTLKEQVIANTNFMASISHEMKTPVAAIDMSLKLLRDQRLGSLNKDQRELTETIRQNSNRLLQMVNDLLEMTRIDTGNIRLNREATNPQFIIEKSLQSVQSLYDEKEVFLKIETEENLPDIFADRHKTIGVLINFLTNALRYSDKGSEVEILLFKRNREVIFCVKDQGCGIPSEDQKKIFERYQRAKDDNTRGTGLGLAISKEFIEMQGGRIWVESQIGKGSRFFFSLPLA